MTNLERMRARYRERRAAGLCVRCAAGLQRHDVLYCVECQEKRDIEQARYSVRNRAAINDSKRKQMNRRYASDPAGHAKRKREERLARKMSGKCYHCTMLALDDSNFCQRHLDLNRASSRERSRIRTGYYDRHPRETVNADQEDRKPT